MHYARIDASSEQEFLEKSIALLGAHLRFLTSEKKRCALGLCGGSTPKPLYLALQREQGIDWSKVMLFLVDDRIVPPDHPDSNQRLVRETLLSSIPLCDEQIIFPRTMLPLEDAVSDYDRRLQDLFEEGSPDIVTLGLGEDGHIASLFPPVPEEAFSEERYALHTTTGRFAVHDRISVTLPLLCNASVQVFFLKGEGKKHVWNEMVSAEEDPRRWPAHAVLKEGRATAVLGT